MYKCNKILLPPIRTKISYVIISMRKPVTFHFRALTSVAYGRTARARLM